MARSFVGSCQRADKLRTPSQQESILDSVRRMIADCQAGGFTRLSQAFSGEVQELAKAVCQEYGNNLATASLKTTDSS